MTTSPSSAPLLATAVLDDAIAAAARFGAAEDPEARRLAWVAATSLLRGVGQALVNDDAFTAPERLAAIRRAFDADRDTPIFRDFIKADRDCLLHAYRHAATETWTLATGPCAGRDATDLLEEAIDFWQAHLAKVLAPPPP